MAKKKATTKKKAGRPKKRFPLSDHIGFAVRPEQKSSYVVASEIARLELSEWCRQVLDREAERLLAEQD